MKKKLLIDIQTSGCDEQEAADRCSNVLPGDLILDILQRLPVKSLLRFESISKAWNVVIRSNKFKYKHLFYQKHKKNNEVKYVHYYSHDIGCSNSAHMHCPPAHFQQGVTLISKGDDSIVVVPFDLKQFGSDLIQKVSIVGSCNGLVCIMFTKENPDGGSSYRYGIWNVATRKFQHLQPTPQPDSAALHNRRMDILVGFSYIPRTSCYKLVQVLIPFATGFKRSLTCVQVLSIGAKSSWKEVVCQGKHKVTYSNFSEYVSVVVNGCMHWVGYLEEVGEVLVSFDLEKEVFKQTTPLPYHQAKLVYSASKLCVLEDNLAMFVHPINRNVYSDRMFEVWGYERTSQSWIKRFSFGPVPYHKYPIGFLGDDGKIIIGNELSNPKAYLYNRKSNQWNALPCTCTDKWCSYELYIETLIEI